MMCRTVWWSGIQHACYFWLDEMKCCIFISLKKTWYSTVLFNTQAALTANSNAQKKHSCFRATHSWVSKSVSASQSCSTRVDSRVSSYPDTHLHTLNQLVLPSSSPPWVIWLDHQFEGKWSVSLWLKTERPRNRKVLIFKSRSFQMIC